MPAPSPYQERVSVIIIIIPRTKTDCAEILTLKLTSPLRHSSICMSGNSSSELFAKARNQTIILMQMLEWWGRFA